MQLSQIPKIFLVDDDTFTSAVYHKHILNIGYTDISIFENGQSCLNNLTENPMIVFLDHEMENLKGFDVLKKIKRYDPNIFVVMVSGQEDMNTAIDSLKYGAFDYIIKGDDTLMKIEKAIKKIVEINTLMNTPKPNFFIKLLKEVI